MRVVLYADDMEPITVLELSDFAAREIEKRGRVSVPIFEPLRLSSNPSSAPTRPDFKRVDIWAEAFERKGVRHLFLFTKDEEPAMLLRSELLPGQRADAQQRERAQYMSGFLAGLRATLGG